MNFGERLKELRESRSLSQEQLADVLKIPRASISHIESSNDKQRYPRVERIEQIADFFNVTIDYLYGRSDLKNESNLDWKERAIKAEARVEALEHLRKLIKSLTEGG